MAASLTCISCAATGENTVRMQAIEPERTRHGSAGYQRLQALNSVEAQQAYRTAGG